MKEKKRFFLNYFVPSQSMKIEPIAFFRSPLTTKFGVPRQSGVVSALPGCVEFVAPYDQAEALRGLEEYDYVWLIWGFSEHVSAEKHPTVRPPLLGGNERKGVWASRSPFRPNNLGLSAVRIAQVDVSRARIDVLGGDLMDGTPIYDVKPYLPYVDSHPEARGGFTDSHQWQQLQVVMPETVGNLFAPADREVLVQLLAQDPRPHYHRDEERLYGMPFMGYDIRFQVAADVLTVVDVVKMA